MGTKTLPQLPVANPIAATDIYHTSQAGVDAQVSAATLAAYIMQASAVAPTEVAISGNTTVSISPVQNQIIIATVAASNYTVTFPAVTVTQKNMRVLIMRVGATAGILSLAGLNNFGGTVRSFNDQDCIVVEVVNTTGSTYAWEVTSVLSTGNYAPTGSSFTILPGDMIRQFNITTGASNFTLTTPAGSSTPLGEYIVGKVDSGAGAVALTPNTGDAYGALSVNTVFYLVNQGDSVHIKSNGVTGYNFIADYSGGNQEHYTVEGGFSVAAGAVVEILADGNIKQFRRYTAAPLDLSLAFQTQRVKIVSLTQTANGGGTAVAFYETSATVITAVVLTITADLVVTAGTPVAVASALTAQSHIMDAVALSSTLVLFTYQTNTGYVQTVANTISISGTTITLNTAANNPDATTTGGVLQFLSSTSAVWMGLKLLSTLYYFSARIISVAGTTITWNGNSDSASQGSTVLTLNGYPGGIVNKALNQCHYLAGYAISANSIGTATWWISGTTITFKQSLNIAETEYFAPIGLAYPSRMDAFALLLDAGYPGRYLPIQIAEAQVNQALIFPFVATNPSGAMLPYLVPLIGQGTVSSGALVPGIGGMERLADDCMIAGGIWQVTVGSPSAAGYSPVFYICEVGPGKIDRVAEAWNADTTHVVTGAWVGRLTDDIAICAWASSTDLYFGALRRRRRVAGIAVDASGTIVRRGLCKGLSGLTPGARYFVSDTGTLVTTGTDLPVGIALSATTLEVDIKLAA